MFLCQYIHSFVLPETSGGGGATAPLAPPLNPPLLLLDTVLLKDNVTNARNLFCDLQVRIKCNECVLSMRTNLDFRIL